jgi:ATP-dependent exoDNAse (exonuclease V) beta subunit
MTIAQDQQGRDLAVDPSKSVIVEAGAGSGKTANLVVRKLRLLAISENPEEVLSITFTRKATAEMRSRVIGALRTVALGATATNAYEEVLYDSARAALKRDKEMGWNLLDNPSRLRVVTFDSLAHMIVRMSPITSQLGGPVVVEEDPSPLYEKAVDRLFQSLDSQGDDSLSQAVFQFLDLMDNRQVRARSFLTNLLARRDQWLAYVLSARDRGEFYDLINESCTELGLGTIAEISTVIEVAGVGPALAQLWSYATENGVKSKAIAELARYKQFPDTKEVDLVFWRGLVDFMLTSGGTFRKRLTDKEGFPAPSKLKGEEKKEAQAMKDLFSQVVSEIEEINPDACALLNRCGVLPEAIEEGSDALALMDTLVEILPVLAADLQVIFTEHGAADHGHVFQAALQALGDETMPGEASLSLDYQIRHILVDEYQDTSKPQTQMLKRLTAGWEQGDGRTLFLVGDPKQSIYKFRDANVSNFLAARRNGLGDIRLTAAYLTENFRSTEAIIEWNNMVYGPVFPAEENIARSEVTFSPSTVPAGVSGGDGVIVRGFYGDPINNAISEADYIATKLKDIQTKHPEETSAILVRNRSHLREILPALKRHKIAWKASDIDPLSSLGVVSDLLCLTRAIMNPMDKLAWVALLRSPLVGITMLEINSFVGRANHVWSALGNIRQPMVPATKAVLDRFTEVMTEALGRYQRKSLRQVVEGAWVALGGPTLTKDAGELEAVRQTLDLISGLEVGGTIMDTENLNRSAARLYASDAAGADNAVEIMTMHKAKGLQFDSVFLPGLANGTRPDEKSLLYWDEWLNDSGQYRMAMAPMAPPGSKDVPLYDFLRARESDKSRQEMARLMYVATTRPQKRLFLTFGLDVLDSGKIATPGKSSLLGIIWKQIEDQAELSESPVRESVTKAPEMVVTRIEGKNFLKSGKLAAPLAQYRGPEQGFGNENVPELSWDNAVAIAAGTVFHRFLQLLNDKQIREVNPADAAKFKPFWERQLRSHGLPIGKLNQGVSLVEEAFKGLNSEDGRYLLADHDQKEAEKPVTLVVDGEAQDLVIDLTFVDNGVRWIVDTKTSAPAEGEPEHAFIARELQRYEEKMALYGKAVAHLGNEPVRLALYLPRIGRVATYGEHRAAA